jgi:hypothetical protein
MAYQRSFRRPAVTDPVLSRAFQQIEDEITKLLALIGAGSGGASTFLALTDTPDAYTDKALKLLRANSGEDAVEFGPAILVSDDAPQPGDGDNGDIFLEY